MFTRIKKTTHGEIKEFKEVWKTQNWNKLATLGVSLHIPRIKRNFSEIFKNKRDILFLEAEKNLDKNDSKMLEKYRNSKEFFLLKFNEQIIEVIQNIPLIGTPILEITARFSAQKGYFQPKIIDFLSKIKNQI